MTKKIRFIYSLNARVMLVLLLALASALPVYFGSRAVGNYMIEKYYMSSDAVSARRVEVYNDLRTYVQKYQLSTRDSSQLGAWGRRQSFAAVSIYTDFARLELGSWGVSIVELSPADRQNMPSGGEGAYYMRFSDGIYPITISEDSQSRKYALCTFISVLLACVGIILIMLIYVHRVTFRVISLADCAYEIGRGDLSREIHVRGRDELAMLGREMDDMRRSIIERMNSERTAWQANSSLITAISHDLRTPMTAMIGYLELLESGEYSDEQQRAHFIQSAHAKAMELKDLTDELFKYFLVFGSSEIALEPETYDAGILLDQIIGEGLIELTAAGFDVRSIKFEGECKIHVDALHLKRVFDNLLSNVRKYADITRPVVIISEKNGERLSVCLSNSIDRNRSRVESTKIGLQTCSRIVSQLGGMFKITGDDEHYVAEVILPIVRE
ncbi:MAG: HAMP domain-containing histidine kinase [Butyricicoccus sp.]|nr:HAMP domain-containing histidine kinase [Butyricicoccus sp.]